VGYLLAPGALFHAERQPSTLMRINFATTQDAQFWDTFARMRSEHPAVTSSPRQSRGV
jgi:DNA-binding transcriptional MocR family regulator